MKLSRTSFFLCWLFLANLLCAGLAPGTQILTPRGLVPIEQLSVGDKVIAGHSGKTAFLAIAIHAIEVYESTELFVITTDKGTILTSGSQHFYRLKGEKFVPACELQPKDVLVSSRAEKSSCLHIQVLQKPVVFYEISLTEKHEYFTGEWQFLTHNSFAVSPGLVPAAGAWLTAPVIARLSLNKETGNKETQRFADFEHGKNVILERIRTFVHQTKEFIAPSPKVRIRTKDLSPSGDRYRHLDNPRARQIDGIDVERQFLEDISEHPSLYGPMCATAELGADGKISCSINVYRFLEQRPGAEIFGWTTIGHRNIWRGYPIVADFVKHEDKKQIDACRTQILQFPDELQRIIKGCGGRLTEEVDYKGYRYIPYSLQFGEYTFTPLALQCVVDKNLSPHSILDTIHHGIKRPTKHPGLTFVLKAETNACVIIDEIAKRVLVIGCFGEADKIDSPLVLRQAKEAILDKTPTNIEDLDKQPGKIDHILSGSAGHDHQWEHLVPNPTWTNIRPIIIEVMETGEDAPPERAHSVKTKTINGRVVHITYVVIDGKRYISNGWVRPKQ